MPRTIFCCPSFRRGYVHSVCRELRTCFQDSNVSMSSITDSDRRPVYAFPRNATKRGTCGIPPPPAGSEHTPYRHYTFILPAAVSRILFSIPSYLHTTRAYFAILTSSTERPWQRTDTSSLINRNVPPANYTLRYNVMPYVGVLTYGESARTLDTVAFPTERSEVA